MTQTLIRTVIDCADDLMDTIEGTTHQFEHQVSRLADAITALENSRTVTIPAHTPGPWTTWPDYGKDGPTGHMIIGARFKPIFRTCEGTSEADRNLASTAPDMLVVLELAARAMNNIPSFDTGIPDDHRPSQSLSSYRLLRRLESVIRKARGQS